MNYCYYVLREHEIESQPMIPTYCTFLMRVKLVCIYLLHLCEYNFYSANIHSVHVHRSISHSKKSTTGSIWISCWHQIVW